MEAILQFGTRIIERTDRLLRNLFSAAKHEQLTGIVFWAALIGVCGAFAGVGFRAGLRLVQQLLTGHSETGLVETAELLPWPARIAIPTIGGAIAGLLLWIGQRVWHTARCCIPTQPCRRRSKARAALHPIQPGTRRRESSSRRPS